MQYFTAMNGIPFGIQRIDATDIGEHTDTVDHGASKMK